MDRTTELIAHFIGLFEIKVDEIRLRQDYLEFRQKQPVPEDDSQAQIVVVRLQAPYQLQPYTPELEYTPLPPEPLPVSLPAVAPAAALEIPPLPAPALPDLPQVEPGTLPQAWSAHIGVIGFRLSIPASVVTVTLQSARLIDDDVFDNGLGADFIDPAALHGVLGTHSALADEISGFASPELPEGGAWMSLAETTLGFIDDVQAPTGSGLQVAILKGAASVGVHIDGASVDEAPAWSDLLPLYLQPEDDAETQTDEDEESPPATPASPGTIASDGEVRISRTDDIGARSVSDTLETHDFSRDFSGYTPNPYSLEPAHKVVTGANMAVNETVVASQWIDAPVIVVRGDVALVDAISQANVLVEHDTIDGHPVTQSSLAHNIAEISATSSEVSAPSPSGGALPQTWHTVRLEADLIQVNWVKQFTFVTDFDRVEVEFSANASFLGFGENEIVNAAAFTEIGYIFDVIFVSGDMLDANIINQKNVLFDTDHITTTTGFAPATTSGPGTEAEAHDHADAGRTPDTPPVGESAAEAAATVAGSRCVR